MLALKRRGSVLKAGSRGEGEFLNMKIGVIRAIIKMVKMMAANIAAAICSEEQELVAPSLITRMASSTKQGVGDIGGVNR